MEGSVAMMTSISTDPRETVFTGPQPAVFGWAVHDMYKLHGNIWVLCLLVVTLNKYLSQWLELNENANLLNNNKKKSLKTCYDLSPYYVPVRV